MLDVVRAFQYIRRNSERFLLKLLRRMNEAGLWSNDCLRRTFAPRSVSMPAFW